MKTTVADTKDAVKRFFKKYFDSVFPAANNIQTVCLRMILLAALELKITF